MTAEIVPPCCGERACQRQQPIRLVHDDDGAWWVVTEYAERAGGQIEARQKHALHPRDARDLERLREAAELAERTGEVDQ